MPAASRGAALRHLHQQLASCRLCLQAGYDIFPRAIHSGDENASIMLIGQAPGITEKDAGRPFNAGSGKRLFQWLAPQGIDETWFRNTQYMTSVTKCYPGRSGSGGGDRAPSKIEQGLCRPFLEQELALVNPQVILPVGKLAIGLFYDGNFSLEEIIGTEKPVDGRWIVPLPHPSGASRWHQSAENRQRIEQAATLIGKHYRRIIELPGAAIARA